MNCIFLFFFIVTSNYKNSMYPRSFLCEEAKIKQRTPLKKELFEIGKEAIWESRFISFFYYVDENWRTPFCENFSNSVCQNLGNPLVYKTQSFGAHGSTFRSRSAVSVSSPAHSFNSWLNPQRISCAVATVADISRWKCHSNMYTIVRAERETSRQKLTAQR